MKPLKLRHLLIAELKFRWASSLMAILAVLVACACVCGSFIALKVYDKETQMSIGELQERSRERMEALESEARIFSKSLGFNIFIYNGSQELGDFYNTDTSTHFLTEPQADVLAKSGFELLNHHLPVLRERFHWKEYGGDVIIGGIKGEIFIKRKWQKPLEVELKPSEVHLGHALAKKLSVEKGAKVMVLGKSYDVTQVREHLGSKDDITLYMNLGDAQSVLNRPGQISGVLAISCNCAAGDVDPIRRGVQRLIPEADVVEFVVRSKARQQARQAVAKTSSAELKDISNSRGDLRLSLSRFSFLFSLFMGLATLVLLVFLYGSNANDRRGEISILKTLGLSTCSIYGLFFAKASVLSLIGCIVGVLLSCSISLCFIKPDLGISLLDFTPLAAIVIASGWAMSFLASWLPARSAVRQDPAVVLSEEG